MEPSVLPAFPARYSFSDNPGGSWQTKGGCGWRESKTTHAIGFEAFGLMLSYSQNPIIKIYP